MATVQKRWVKETKRARKNIFWARVIGTLVVEAYLPVETFSELQRQAQELRALQARHADAV